MFSRNVALLITVATIAFFLNLAWEILQSPLFSSFINYQQHLLKCLVASIGDAIVILLFYLAIAAMHKNLSWIKNVRATDIIYLTLMGFAFSIVFEKLALSLGWWSYKSTMPLLPILKVGLIPAIQMTILPSLIIVIVKRILLTKKFSAVFEASSPCQRFKL